MNNSIQTEEEEEELSYKKQKEEDLKYINKQKLEFKEKMEIKYKNWIKVSEKSTDSSISIVFKNPITGKIEVEKRYILISKPIKYSKVGSTYNSFKNIITVEKIILNEDKPKNSNLLNYYPLSKKKMNLNIIYYSDSLLKDMELSDYCAFLQMNINGTFYGIHNMNLLNLIYNKIRKSDRDFILITSGSSAEKVYQKLGNLTNIREYYIYCFLKEKYSYLYSKYNKLKGIYNDARELNKKLSVIETKINNNIKSSNLIFFEDYSRIFIKLHFEIIRKYSLYKLLKENNFNEQRFLEKVKFVNPKFLNIAKQLIPDKSEIINYFTDKLDLNNKIVSEVFNNDGSIENFISNYTADSFYYSNINKFLREGDFDSFRILSSHLSKFIYYLYEYREKNPQVNYNLTLYRRMNIDYNDLNVYKKSINRVICYPAFTSTSSDLYGFNYGFNTLLIINSNYSKSVVSIENFSKFKKEKEYLFLPFSFFKIVNVKINEGTKQNPHIINLIAINSEKPIEEMFLNFVKNFSDSLDPEGLDILKLFGDKIIFNSDYYC